MSRKNPINNKMATKNPKKHLKKTILKQKTENSIKYQETPPLKKSRQIQKIKKLEKYQNKKKKKDTQKHFF